MFSRLFVIGLVIGGFSSLAVGQEEMPVLRSGSEQITIVDGDHVKENYWYLMPEKEPDIYYVEIPMKRHTVTFRTDIEERSFDVSYGDVIDFVIMLNGETMCRTQIRAEFRNPQPFTRDESLSPTGDVEIPFTRGDNDKIYVEGRLNKGEVMRFQFDLGNGGTIIKKASVPMADLDFDGTATLHNSDGVNEVPSSTSNDLEVAGLHWSGLAVVVGDNMSYREDGLLGNILFQDKVVEIDYDRGVMVIHDSMPTIDVGYSKHAIVLDGVVPFIRGSLTINDEQREGWFMFDTGAYTSILFTDEWRPWSKLLVEMRGLFGAGTAMSGPRLTVGNYTFSGFNYSLRGGGPKETELGVLGNDILKRFNVILDNQNGFIYLKPNTLAEAGYRNPEYYLARGIVGVGAVGITAIVWLIRRRRLRARKAACNQV